MLDRYTTGLLKSSRLVPLMNFLLSLFSQRKILRILKFFQVIINWILYFVLIFFDLFQIHQKMINKLNNNFHQFLMIWFSFYWFNFYQIIFHNFLCYIIKNNGTSIKPNSAFIIRLNLTKFEYFEEFPIIIPSSISFS